MIYLIGLKKKHEYTLLCFSQVNVSVLLDGEEKELPDDLENICSANSDGNCLFANPLFLLPQTRTCSTSPDLFTALFIVVMVFGFVYH